jgi:hypothetical protein
MRIQTPTSTSLVPQGCSLVLRSIRPKSRMRTRISGGVGEEEATLSPSPIGSPVDLLGNLLISSFWGCASPSFMPYDPDRTINANSKAQMYLEAIGVDVCRTATRGSPSLIGNPAG